jgi:hypothetical protein
MAGPVPAIHVFDTVRLSDVDARDKRGHDESITRAVGMTGLGRGFPRALVENVETTVVSHQSPTA